MLDIENIKLVGDALLKYCSKNDINMTTNVITNGILLDDYKFDILKKYNLEEIQISMDGCEEYYHKYKNVNGEVFDRLLYKIKKYCKAVKIVVRLNCSKENYDSIKDLTRRFYNIIEIRENIVFPLLNYEMIICQC